MRREGREGGEGGREGGRAQTTTLLWDNFIHIYMYIHYKSANPRKLLYMHAPASTDCLTSGLYTSP